MTDAAHIYQLMVLTAWSDGHLHELEQRMAGHLLAEVPDLGGLDDKEELARDALARLKAVGVRAAVDEVAGRIEAYHFQRLAVVCCARVLAADGKLAAQEFAVISQLRSKFGLTVDDVTQILAEATRR